MTYLVFARKYRPQTFEELVGQDHVTQTLANALTAKRLAHAYVFSGPRGCGKTTTARILAKALNCAKGPTPHPCGECPQCKDIAAAGSTDDVLEIDGASNRGIDQIRELRDTVRYAPARSRYRVVIIDEAHQISKDGFNALLKTLEEPPPHVVFMMATTEANKIPETILSRCQRFQLKNIAAPDIVKQVQKILAAEKLSMDEAALLEVARAAHGSLRDALSLLDQVIAYAPKGAAASDVRDLLGLLPQALVQNFMATINAGSAEGVLQTVDKLVAEGVDLGQLAEDLTERYHRLLLWKAGVKDEKSPDAKDLEAESAGTTVARLERDLAVISRAVSDLRRSESPRVTFELACLELAQPAMPVSEILDRLEALEKSLGDGTPLPEMPAPRPAAVYKAPAPTPPTSRPAPAQSFGTAPTQSFGTTPAQSFGTAPTQSFGTAGGSRGPETPAAVVGSSQAFILRPDEVRQAWSKMMNEVGAKKPSLESYLLASRWHVVADNVLEVTCAHEFHKQQLQGQESFWGNFLRATLGGNWTIRLVAEAPKAVNIPVVSVAPPAEPAEEAGEDEGGVVEDSDPEPSPVAAARPAPAVTDAEIAAVAEHDAGLKKVLGKFSGKVRKLEE